MLIKIYVLCQKSNRHNYNLLWKTEFFSKKKWNILSIDLLFILCEDKLILSYHKFVRWYWIAYEYIDGMNIEFVSISVIILKQIYSVIL
jgi:hypothetical protein